MMKALLSATAALVLPAQAAAQDPVIAITNGELHMTSEDGAKVMGGTVLVRDGRITAVGQNIEVPSGARIIDAEGRPVTPGFFVPVSAIGLTEIGLDREANDSSADNPDLTVAVSAADGFNPDSSVIAVTRAGGITRAYTAVDSAAGLFSGCGMVISMTNRPDAVTEPCAAMSARLGQSGADRAGGSRPAAFAAFRRALDDALAFDRDPQGYALTQRPGRLSAADAEALLPVARGERRLMVQVESAADIRRLLDVRDEFGLDVVLLGGAEAYRVAGEIADADMPVIMNPLANLPTSFETMGASEKAAIMLEEAGVEVTFYDPGVAYTHNARLMPQLAGNAVAEGMAYDAAMEAVTLTPARIFGLDDDLGTLETGKIADIVVWEADPFEVTTRPRHVLVEGEVTSLDNRQKALAERYRDLGRGDLPFQYRNK